MLRCDSVAPLGKPVVPDVYWMLIGSVLEAGHPVVHGVGVDASAPAAQVVPVVGADEDDRALGAGVAAHLFDHRAVVAGLELRRGRSASAAPIG